MRKIICITAIVLSNFISILSFGAGGSFINVKKAFDEGLIQVTMSSLGCFNGKCLTMDIINVSDETLIIEIDAGQLLEPFDSRFYKYMVKERQKLALPVESTKNLVLDVFSTNVKKGTPEIASFYSFADSTPNLWNQVTNYLALNNYDLDLAQKAVWSVTCKFPVEAVCSKDKYETKRIRMYLSSILPIDDVWVNVFFKKDEKGLPIKKLDYVRFEMPYYVRNNAMLDFYIVNERGILVEKLVNGLPKNPGKHVFEHEFKVENWKFGKYYLMMRSEGQLLLKKEFYLNQF